ncbi:hypothetical protein BKI52_02600 [marine bacterium AO1-C]|nr:hypothetical protein BKI52_02600 [marine bacterium AO1-C]
MEPVYTIIISLVTGLFALVPYFMKVLMDKKIKEELQEHQAALKEKLQVHQDQLTKKLEQSRQAFIRKNNEHQHRLNEKLESTKQNLDTIKSTFLHKATRLHEERLVIYAELFSKIHQISKELKKGTVLLQDQAASEELFHQLKELFDQFTDYFSEKSIYLEPVFEEKLLEFTDFLLARIMDIKISDGSLEENSKYRELINTKLPEIQQSLKQEFRKLLSPEL